MISRILLVIALLSPFAVAAPDYQSGTLVNIEKKVELVPLTWLWDTPVTFTETVHYRLSVRVGNTTYLSEYTPLIQPDGPIPSQWKAGNTIDVRIEKRKLFLKLSYDGETETQLLRRSGS